MAVSKERKCCLISAREMDMAYKTFDIETLAMHTSVITLFEENTLEVPCCLESFADLS
jgi:hypothetical protein